MPTNNMGKKKKSSLPSKKNDEANKLVVRSPQATHQTRLKETLNLHKVNQPTPLSGSYEEDIEVCRNVFPPTHQEYSKKYKKLPQQEPVFKFIKKKITGFNQIFSR